MSVGKKLLLGVLTAAVLLGLLEGIARLLGGTPTPELVARLPDGKTELIRRTPTAVEPLYQQTRPVGPVSLEPSAGERRVLWLGGSSIHGGTQGLSIEDEAPGRLGEILGVTSLNFGGIGMDTVTIGSILDHVVALSPDVVVLYSGHNELGNAVFTGRYGDARTARIASVRGWLGGSRAYQFLEMSIRGQEQLILPSAGTEGRFEVTEPIRDEINRRFEERLLHIVSRLTEANIPVVLSTLMSNPIAPSVEFSCPDAVFATGFPAGRAEARPVDSLTESDLQKAEAMAPGCRDLDWIRARRNPNRSDATTALDELRDSDPIPVRADRSLNAVVRRVAGGSEATLVDVDGFARMAGEGVEPPSWFLDPMHLTVDGHNALARMIGQGVAPLLGLTPPSLPRVGPDERNLAGCGSEGCRERSGF